MNLKLLSPNLIILLKEVMKNQNICKLLTYNSENPFIEPDITDTNSLMFDKIFPFPFGLTTNTEEGTQLRIYYYKTRLKHNKVIEDTTIFFDIICSKTKNVWLINDGEPKIRPYEIASELITHLGKEPIGTVGKLNFEEAFPIHLNEKFDAIRVVGKMMTIGR
jgi:hypothetical protein